MNGFTGRCWAKYSKTTQEYLEQAECPTLYNDITYNKYEQAKCPPLYNDITYNKYEQAECPTLYNDITCNKYEQAECPTLYNDITYKKYEQGTGKVTITTINKVTCNLCFLYFPCIRYLLHISPRKWTCGQLGYIIITYYPPHVSALLGQHQVEPNTVHEKLSVKKQYHH
jgi:hypothetical protein